RGSCADTSSPAGRRPGGHPAERVLQAAGPAPGSACEFLSASSPSHWLPGWLTSIDPGVMQKVLPRTGKRNTEVRHAACQAHCLSLFVFRRLLVDVVARLGEAGRAKQSRYG